MSAALIDQAALQPQLVALLKQTIGNRVELVRKTIVKQRLDYLVAVVWLRHPSMKLVVKLAEPGAAMASDFDRTAMLHRLVASRTTIAIPQILTVDVSCRDYPWRYLVRVYLPGREWWKVQHHLPAEELYSAYQQLGVAVAQLHSIHFPAFGELGVDGNLEDGQPFLDAFRKRAQHSIRNPRLLELFLPLLDMNKHLFQDVHGPCLCHEDLHAHNILFHFRHGRWQLVSLLDFDKAWAGHHEIDLARMEFWRGVIGPAFWPTYQSIIPIDSRYQQRRLIYQFLWCLEFAQPTPQHLNDTQALCAQLGLPPIASF